MDRPALRGQCQEAKRGEAGGHRLTRNCEALGAFLLTCATTALSLIAMWRLIGATSRGQQWTPTVTLPHGRDGLSARRMAVVWTFHEPSLDRHVPHEFMRNAVLHSLLIIPATICHQRNYVDIYSRYTGHDPKAAWAAVRQVAIAVDRSKWVNERRKRIDASETPYLHLGRRVDREQWRARTTSDGRARHTVSLALHECQGHAAGHARKRRQGWQRHRSLLAIAARCRTARLL